MIPQAMKTTSRILIIASAFSLILTQGCFKTWDIVYEQGFFSDTVKNMGGVNSTYDDYNTTGMPTISFYLPIVFSSNRTSLGGKFDLVDYELYAEFNQVTGSFSLTAYDGSYPFNYLTDLCNTNDNEFGPTTCYVGGTEYFFLFASDRTSSMDLYASYFNSYSFTTASPLDPTPFRIVGANLPDSYEAYATLSKALAEFLFASNRDGDLDIYRIKFDENDDLYSWARIDTTYPAERLGILNSDSADMYPYINGNLLVFASTREEGYGGYDLYYSRRQDGEWTTPVNFGPAVNSPEDDCRPVVFLATYFTNDLMIFSSNRPGGKGGFDLYYVGIPKMIE